MKKLLFLTGCIFIQQYANAQATPLMPVDNLHQSGGTLVIHAPYDLTGPYDQPGSVQIDNTAQVDFFASQRIHLQPGFQASQFSGNGYFHAQIGPAPDFDVVFIEPNEQYPQVGQFEKLELGLKLPAAIEQSVANFVHNGNGINPFDPDQISVEAHFMKNNLDYTVYGFYYQDYVRDPDAFEPYLAGPPGFHYYEHAQTVANWLSVPTDYKWRIRFAPPFTGRWNCKLNIRLNNGPVSYSVDNVIFTCVTSANQGWLKAGNDDWHLAYSGTQNSFFALGQNIPFPDNDGNGNACFRGGERYQDYPGPFHGGYLDILDWIDNLHQNGGNMVRISNVPWSYELEYDRLGDYSDRLNRAWELDQVFALCENENMKISIAMHDKRFSLTDQAFSWYTNPYNVDLNTVTDPIDFFTDPDAKAIFQKKERYFLARWGYSTSLGILSIMGEITNDWDEQNQELTTWYNSMLLTASILTPYRPLLTTTSYGAGEIPDNFHASPFNSSLCSMTSQHSYHSERNSNFTRYDEFNGIIRRGLDLVDGTHLRWPEKPTYFEEMGLAGTPLDASDFEGCSDVSFHNALWSTSFMGGIGCGLPWWQWSNDYYREQNYPALTSFFNTIDFQSATFKDPDWWDDATPNDHTTSSLEVFYIRDENADRVMGWIHNPTWWWGNITPSCIDNNGVAPTIPEDDDATNSPSDPTAQEVELSHLNNLSHYTVQWYSTFGAGGLVGTEQDQTNIFGKLYPTWQGGSDWAFKAFRAGNNFRMNDEITTDTLRCDEDTVHAYGRYMTDTLNTFSYFWDFGNGVTSNLKDPIVIYSNPGTFLVTLIVSDSTGWSDTLQQFVVKQSCSTNRTTSTTRGQLTMWSISPNPATHIIQITLDTSWTSRVFVMIYNSNGQMVKNILLEGDPSLPIPIDDLSAGLYLAVINDGKQQSSKKFIIKE